MARTDQLRQARDRFIALLENPDSLEREWQSLFTEFPFILIEGLALDISQEQLVPCKPGRAEADFYFYPETDNQLSPYGVIEIKRPSTPVLRVPRRDVVCLSAEATTAVAQAQKYATKLNAQIAKLSSQPLVLGNSLHMFIIAGLSRELAGKLTSEILTSQAAKLLPPQCRLVPFDVLARALASRVPPRLHVAVPVQTAMPEDRPVPRLMYVGDWTCSQCGRAIGELPFKPRQGSPLYCRHCHGTAIRAIRMRKGLRAY